MKKLQLLLAGGIVIFGILSLLATVPSDDSFSIYTLNDQRGNSFPGPLYACRDEKVFIRWDLLVSGQATLNSIPVDSFNPKIEFKTIQASGEMTTAFLKPAKLTVTLDKGVQEYSIDELSEDICTGFPISPVVGNYTGLLTQTLPQPASIESQMQLIWASDKLNARVDGRALFPCTFDAGTDSIMCIEGDEAAPTFRFEGAFVESIFQGTYLGIAETAGVKTSFEGRFSFSKPVP
jgi:hypothetical protein